MTTQTDLVTETLQTGNLFVRTPKKREIKRDEKAAPKPV
jgi:hypothetical protein